MDSSVSTRMRSVLSQFPGSGQRVGDFCKCQGLSISQYHYWRKKLGFYFRGKKGDVGFVRVKFQERSFSAALGTPGWFELQLSGGRVLRIPPQFDSGSLKTVLQLLDS